VGECVDDRLRVIEDIDICIENKRNDSENGIIRRNIEVRS
jgi:hypothetical protein